MKTQKAPDRKKRFSIFLLVLCLVGYAVFAATRYSGYSTYVPFTGQIFRLKAGEVESVRITNGSTGVTCNYAEGEEGFSDLLDTLKSYEENAATLLDKQRDHYVHSVNVFLLGLAVYAVNPRYREVFRTAS